MLMVALGACSGAAMDCTVAGCTDQISVTPPAAVSDADLRAASLEVCKGEACKTTQFGKDGSGTGVVSVLFGGTNRGDGITATLVLADGTSYAGDGVIRTIAPNGQECGPVCDVGEVALTHSVP
jgi:hypothetical protein